MSIRSVSRRASWWRSSTGPAVQDLWLFLAGSRDEMAAQLGDLLEGYGKFADFDYRELQLIEA